MDDTIDKVIVVGGLLGEKATGTGKRYWQIQDAQGHKYRVWDLKLYEEFTINGRYTVEVSLYRTKYQGKDITINSIRSIKDGTVSLDDSEPIDQAIKQVQPQEPNWDAIARGKVRNAVAVAFIGKLASRTKSDIFELSNWNLNMELEEIMEQWVDYIMNGPEK